MSSKCVSQSTFKSDYASEFLQNITIGRHRQCGDSESSVLIEEFKVGLKIQFLKKDNFFRKRVTQMYSITIVSHVVKVNHTLFYLQSVILIKKTFFMLHS